jgi:hypothetical protein
MSQYDLMLKEWKKTTIQEPRIKILVCKSNLYAVVEDHTTIVVIASKSETVYAVTKNRLTEVIRDGIPVYTLDDIKKLKIISCTKETIEKRHKDQSFVINNIVKFI